MLKFMLFFCHYMTTYSICSIIEVPLGYGTSSDLIYWYVIIIWRFNISMMFLHSCVVLNCYLFKLHWYLPAVFWTLHHSVLCAFLRIILVSEGHCYLLISLIDAHFWYIAMFHLLFRLIYLFLLLIYCI